jgi:hypothetical protein
MLMLPDHTSHACTALRISIDTLVVLQSFSRAEAIDSPVYMGNVDTDAHSFLRWLHSLTGAL